ncbi:MAG: DUF1674 domain-containing protein [Chromatiaceae bacterium]|jgi:hypothetical protein|nr:DUF1674 domain-containing protein [Chromatiaceae bacterium]
MNSSNKSGSDKEASATVPDTEGDEQKEAQPQGHREVGGPPGPEPTRYGDWEKGGRCIDF